MRFPLNKTGVRFVEQSMKQKSANSRKSELLREYFHNAALIALFKELTVESGVMRWKYARGRSLPRASGRSPFPTPGSA